MKLHFKLPFFLIFLIGIGANAQDYFPKNKEFNGNYYAINSEKIKDRFGNEGDYIKYESKIRNNEKIVDLTMCELCMPTIFRYTDKSKKLKKPVFVHKDSKRILVQYDKDVFFLAKRNNGKNEVHYYSKDQKKANAMTEAEALELWRSLFRKNN